MAAYNFMAQFEEPIRLGTKFQTVRRPRKRKTRPGQRTPACKLIRMAVCCSLQKVRFDAEGYLTLAGCFQNEAGRAAFARADGFDDWDMFVSVLKSVYGLPFEGEVIRWYP